MPRLDLVYFCLFDSTLKLFGFLRVVDMGNAVNWWSIGWDWDPLKRRMFFSGFNLIILKQTGFPQWHIYKIKHDLKAVNGIISYVCICLTFCETLIMIMNVLIISFQLKYLYQGMCSKQGPTLCELCLHFRLRTFRQGTELKYKQTTVLDKSGHGCGRFNEIKANRITTHRYM